MSSIEMLSNADLRAEILQYGGTIGPITTTTRSVYEKKLIKLRQSANNTKNGKTDVVKTSSKSRNSSRSPSRLAPTNDSSSTNTNAGVRRSTTSNKSSTISITTNESTPTAAVLRSMKNIDVGNSKNRASTASASTIYPTRPSIASRIDWARDSFDIGRGGGNTISPTNQWSSSSDSNSSITLLNRLRRSEQFNSNNTPQPPLSTRVSGGGIMQRFGNLFSRFRPPTGAASIVSRALLIIFIAFMAILVIAYVVSIHRSTLLEAWTVIRGAAVDTADFFFLYAIFPSIIALLIIVLLAAIYYGDRFRRRSTAELQKQRFDMVNSIIEILWNASRNGKNADDAYLSIPHVRDMLIPASERKSRVHIWEWAVGYINSTESRVSTETRLINGIECLVWRWLPSSAANSNGRNRDALWQGSAFSDKDAKRNAPVQPFSQCLKLRGMFDPNGQTIADWPDFVQDALLEKLGNLVQVLHIAVDKSSRDGVVYMKLRSERDAEIAYRALHGAWFDGRIVSVKYLRVERYLQRFPEAVNAIYPLHVKKARHTTFGSSAVFD